MKKRKLHLMYWIFLLIGVVQLQAQIDSVEYQIRYDTAMCRWDAYVFVRSGTSTLLPQRIQLQSQYSIVTDADIVVNVLQSHNPRVLQGTTLTTNVVPWVNSTQVFNPAVTPLRSYNSITPNLPSTSAYAELVPGQYYKLFSFELRNRNTNTVVKYDCGNTLVRPFINGSDPNSQAQGMNNLDFTCAFTLLSPGQLLAGTQPTVGPTPPTLNFDIACSRDVSINLTPIASACYEPITYAWSGPNGYTGTSQDVSISPATAANGGIYTVTVTDGFNCTTVRSDTVFIKPQAGPDQSTCPGSTVNLVGTAPATGSWIADPANLSGATLTPGSNGMASVTLDASALGSYQFLYDNNGCADTMVISISNIDAGPDPDVVACWSSGTAMLEALGTGTWSIDASSAGTATIANPSNASTTISGFSGPGLYILNWTNGNCSDQVEVTVNNECDCATTGNDITPPITTSFCGTAPASTLLGGVAGPAGGTYSWVYSLNNAAFAAAPGNNTLQDYNTTTLNEGNHRFARIYTYTQGMPCSDTSNIITIDVNNQPGVPTGLTANPNPACLGATVELQVNNIQGVNYTWTATSNAGLVASTSNTATITPTAVGSYTVSVTQAAGICESNPASISVTIQNTPPTPIQANITSTNPSNCGVSDGSISIAGYNPNQQYVLKYTRNGNPLTATITANASGVIILGGLSAGSYNDFVVSNAAGCDSGIYTGAISLTDPNPPTSPTNVTASPNPACVGQTINLNASGSAGATYTWTASASGAGLSNATSSSTTMVPTTAGSYTINVTQTVAGCTSQPASVSVIVNPSPATPTNANITSTNPTGCGAPNGTITISGYIANTDYTLNYTFNGTPISVQVTTNGSGEILLMDLMAGGYTSFSVENDGGCSSGIFAGPIILSELGAPPAPTGLVANPNPGCLGQTIGLSVNNSPGATFTWSADNSAAGLASSTTNIINMTPTSGGVFNISVFQTVAGCTSPASTIQVMVRENCANPDFGVTFIDIPLAGVLSTNDGPVRYNYSNVQAVGTNPSPCTPMVSSNGTYTFNCSTKGEYEFTVEVCGAGQTPGCRMLPLSITVLEPLATNNAPVGNHDYVATNMNNDVVIASLLNDKCQSLPNCNLTGLSIITAPVNGTFNTITGVYNPSNNYTGRDSFMYEICQSPSVSPTNCDRQWVYINVYPEVATMFTSAMDDYNQTFINTPITANALQGARGNDTDPRNSALTVDAFSRTINGKGTLVMNGDGSYTFTPVQGFVGPVDFAYKVCRSNNGTVCDSATLHILVDPQVSLGVIGDYVWQDTDGDGVQDANEQGIPGVMVVLYNSDGFMVTSTVTDNNGQYLFEDVFQGDYYLEFRVDSKYTATFANIGSNDRDSDVDESNGPNTTAVFTVNGGETNLTIDAGYYVCSKIGDNVWYDINKNDVYEITEPGLNGVKVRLFRQTPSGFVLWDEAVTGWKPGTGSDDGYYQFCAPPGTYYIRVSNPGNELVFVRPFIGSNRNIDSDINGANGPGTSPTFTLTSGQNKTDLGAGFYPMAVAGNLVWFDDNNNGIQDTNEPKASGVLVKAYDATTNDMLGQAVTKSDGTYTIDYLEVRDVYLKFEVPTGYFATSAQVGNDEVDSDVDHSFGYNTTRMFRTVSGARNLNIDLGLASSILPVEWVGVKAIAEEDYNLVTWETSTEINVQEYIVERKLAHEVSFTSISKEMIRSKNGQKNKYSFLDNDVKENGLYTYRIKQIDFDGNYEYSDLAETVRISEGDISVYPNPATDYLVVTLYGKKDQKVNIQVIDSKGQIMKNVNKKFNTDGSVFENISIEDLTSGQYQVQISIGSKVLIERLIKI